MAKYKVAIGKPFAVDGAEIEDIDEVERLAGIDERRMHARRQALLTYGVLFTFFVALSVATLIGWHDGTYDELGHTWSAGALWVGVVLGRYFKKG